MNKKIFVPLYAEHVHFLIKSCRWLLTRIYAHFTFEQSMLKKEFVVINQISRRNAK